MLHKIGRLSHTAAARPISRIGRQVSGCTPWRQTAARPDMRQVIVAKRFAADRLLPAPIGKDPHEP
jgi:hypothetical protein